MPIYAYRCEACGFTKDVLQKVSDAPLTECASCGKSAFKKQLTAAGFQLKGTGWYVTDFRGGAGNTNAAAPAKTTDSGAKADSPIKGDAAGSAGSSAAATTGAGADSSSSSAA